MSAKDNGIIVRHGLKKMFDNLADGRMIYVCAPAGYGKTVAVRQWLNEDARAKTFVSLDESDNNIARFCERFCAALCSGQPRNVSLAEIVSHPAFCAAPDEFTLRAVRALSAKKRTVFVLDDLHFVHDEAVLRFLLLCLRRLPENFMIVLVSRNDLPPGFSDLWIKGELTRITADDLRFGREEIIRVFKKNGKTISPEKADEIFRYTDGWAIGIGALVLSDGNLPGGNPDYPENFISDNIWRHRDEKTREFMLKTSVVNEMTPALCAVLTNNPDSDKILRQLLNQNAFLSRSESGVYRYHRLFHDCLYHMLKERGEEYTRVLLEKAGGWYLGQRDFHNAMDCFLRCENYGGIAQCIGFLVTRGREYVPTETLLPIARSPIVRRAAEHYPYLYSLLSWAAFSDGRAAEAAELSDLYYTGQAEIVRLNPGLAHSIMFVRLVDFRTPMLGLAQSAAGLSVKPTDEKPEDMRHALGTLNQNMPLLHRGTRDLSECARGDVKENISGIIGALGGLFGDEARLLEECMMAGLLYEQGYLDRACSHAHTAGAEIKEHFVAETKFFALAVLVYILDSLGHRTQSDGVLQSIDIMIEKNKAYYLNYNFDALKTRRRLYKGDSDAAGRWLKEHGNHLQSGLDFYRSYGYVTTCRAYITTGAYDSAVILLEKVLTLMEAYNRPLDIIETKILLAIALWKKKRGFQDEAIQYLEQAVLAAHEFGYTQLFVNEGAELYSMLRRLQRRLEQRNDVRPSYISFVKMLYLKTLGHRDEGLTGGRPVSRPKFTDKQKTVMRLQCEGKTYREIAGAMGIKLPTLRSHIALIYKKLDVTCELDAVLKIKSLGIFAQD